MGEMGIIVAFDNIACKLKYIILVPLNMGHLAEEHL